MFGGGIFGNQNPAQTTGGIGQLLGNVIQDNQGQQQQSTFGAPQGGAIFANPAQQQGLFGSAPGAQGQTGFGGLMGGQMQQGGLGGGLGLQQQPQGTFGLTGGLGQPQGLGQQAPTFGGLGGGLGTGLGGNPGSGFGQQTGMVGQAPQTGGLFGQQPQNGGGLFGQQQQPTLFGQQQPQQQQATGLFSVQPPVNQPYGQQQQQQGGLFGQTPQQPQQAGYGYGQQSTTPSFGGNSLFGQQQPQQQGGVLGMGVGLGQQAQPGNQIVLPGGVDDSVNDASLEQRVRLEDTVSAISWGTTIPNFLAISSWDGKVRILEIQQNSYKRELFERRSFQVDGQVGQVKNPIICMDAKGDLSQIFVGCGFDHTVKVIDTNSGQIASIGQHQALIISVYWIESAQMILSISTDQSLKMWDVRAPGQPRFQCQFQYKPLVSDCNFPLLVIGFASEKLSIINLNELQQLPGRFQYIDSPLGTYSQLTALAIFPSRDGFTLGSIDGRGHQTNITTKQTQGMPTEFQLKSIMTFKAHKVEDNQKGKVQNYFFPVNCIQMNIKNNYFLMTAGGEGQMIFWDINVRNKIRTFQFNCNPIVCAKMSPDGSMLAYALGNDFSKGPEFFNEFQPKIQVHFIPENELRYPKN
ncbi:unnamed protein product (macronuclear) [Paramecium tetraurelia]|uniref:Uncharacterized protein n=1 Tax=Paramecium tetraurelia TaxID=5888 RepID=A0D1H4_PARTE|nr:uncharacterized protein GSPATT00012415001 [Paramecium tetraurelia]CAK76891.1 unnamed protein product [Paramecium tetraurelia]|eukprot:XP_001444288.1 hypothetical protein (macronuclear) [Paramecium tetraurelia strain d4-2]